MKLMERINVSKKLIGMLSLVTIMGCTGGSAHLKSVHNQEELMHMLQKNITNAQELEKLFPKTVDEIKQYTAWVLDQTTQELDKIFALDDAARTYENTIKAFDLAGENFSVVASVLMVLEMVSPVQEIRDAAREHFVKLKEFSVDHFSSKKVYHAFKAYVQGKALNEKLSSEAQYYLDESMKSFKRSGLDLPDEKYAEVQSLKKELAKLSTQFDSNIASDQNFILAKEDELKGMDAHIVSGLEKDDKGNYKLKCDYPTFFDVIENAVSSRVRKDLYRAFNRRAYPNNYDLLNQIAQKRHELAQKLGFDNFAALDLEPQMVKTIERSDEFLKSLIKKCQKKADQEFSMFAQDLPEGVSLNEEGKFNPWDFSYVKSNYKKKNFALDERKIAEYFPAQSTLDGVFDIYQNFLDLKFTLRKPTWAWHDEVKLIEVHDNKTGRLRGFVYLDLYPRAHKYSHACHAGLVSTIDKKMDDNAESLRPSVALVIANFPKPAGDRPALLKFKDVETFFHEFGHAMHALLGSTELASNSGTSVKCDFVEMPSQMFEEWLYQKDILKPLTKHFETGEQLPDEMIDKMIALKKFDSGHFVIRQCWLALVSLNLFKSPNTDIDELVKNLTNEWISSISYDPESRFCASFGHLTNYGAKYYSYMWSKVFALDVFDYLKEQGLTKPETGQAFVSRVLGRGGSVDPEEMLKDLLGRAPSDDAFVKDLGIS